MTMSKKRFLRSSLILLAFLLVFSTFGMGTTAQTGATVTPQKLAELFGNVDVNSSKSTTVIVELVEESIVEAKHKGKNQTKAGLAKARKQVKDAVSKAAKSSKVGREYDYVFSGFSVELAANEIPALLAIPGVKAVYPNVTYTETQVGDGQILTEEVFSPAMVDSAPFIGADQAWNAGFTGKGITVAVIDTGVDYTHPDLAHAFGDYKGYDFVNDDNDPQEGPGQYHGTHVAGTVAANGIIKGVAPQAKLLGYRVLGPNGGTTEDVVAGVELAVKDGADIMNLSLGNSLNAPDWATSIALDWAMAEGVVAVTSNGNSGPNNWTVGSPGTSRQAISVGATQLPYDVYNSVLFTSEGVAYPSAKVQGFPSVDSLLELNSGEFEFVHVGLGAASDFVGKDLTGKIALISRGDFAFVDKAQNAKNAGAVGAIIYNNVAGEHADVPGLAVPTIKTTLADGQKLLAELAAGKNKIKFNVAYSHRVGETVASFSSRGPAIGTWMIKPDVSAPGVAIVSTFPGNSYAALQGTSMASPHVAGAAALILQANPTWTVDQVKAALMNTAVDLVDPTGKQYPHNSQGAGSIRPLDAINAKTLVTPGSHSFGTFLKTDGVQVKKQSFTIQNLSTNAKKYTYEASFNGNPSGIKVMTSKNLNVPAGKTQQVNFNVQVDTSKLTPGYYEGTIVVSDGTTSFNIPTILFVQEPDYKRVTHLYATQVSSDKIVIEGYYPTGAETVELFVYESNSVGAPLKYVGDITTLTNVGAGFQAYDWDGTINGQKLAPGYYNVYAYATKAGKTDLAGVNFQLK